MLFGAVARRALRPFPTRRSSDLPVSREFAADLTAAIAGLPRPFDRLFERHVCAVVLTHGAPMSGTLTTLAGRSEEHTSELQSLRHLVCRLLLEKKNARMLIAGIR